MKINKNHQIKYKLKSLTLFKIFINNTIKNNMMKLFNSIFIVNISGFLLDFKSCPDSVTANKL